ncbi:MAG: hypothetical protein R3E57_05700 [Porticoccaceae bacterium]
MSLYINVTTANPELGDSAIQNAITTLAAVVAERRRSEPMPAAPALDLTFMLPGKFDKPGFTGMRMGGYTREEGTLYFETAVPDHILHSSACTRYVSAVLEDMVDNAGDFFINTDIPFDLEYWRKLATQVSQLLAESSPAS